MLKRLLASIDRRIDWRVDRKIEERVLPHFPRYEEHTRTIESVATEFSEAAEKMLFTMSELRRWMVDDLDASNETVKLLGESLARLQAAVDRLGDDVQAIRRRVDGAAESTAPASDSSARPV